MEVDNNRPVPAVSTGNKQGAPVDQHKKDPSGHSGNPSAQSEKISLTDASRQLQELEKLIASQPVVDAQRVSALREAIARDQFAVDADSIAEKLLRIEQLLTDTSPDNP